MDPNKGGALSAASAAEFLPENYHIHILGFGSPEKVAGFKQHVELTQRRSKAKISYDGVLQGEEYVRFLQSCDIGLSTQNPDAAFNGTSFPSKILSYMANGLRVVSIRIPVVELSEVGSVVEYYDEQTPGQIAEAIRKVDLDSHYDSRNLLNKLDASFRSDLGKVFPAVPSARRTYTISVSASCISRC